MARIVKDPEVRQQEILDGALELFCEKGYEAATMGEIARRLGIAQGLCYRYFPSKEALLDRAVEQYAQSLAGRAVSWLRRSAGKSLEELVEEMPLLLEQEGEDSPSYRFPHGAGNERVHAQLSLRVCALLRDEAVRRLEEARRSGEFSLPDAETAADFLIYGQLGVLLRNDLDRDEKVRRIRAFCREALFSKTR